MMMVGVSVDDFAQGTLFGSMEELDAKFRKFCTSNDVIISVRNTQPSQDRPKNKRTRRYYCQRGGRPRAVVVAAGCGLEEEDGEGDGNADAEGNHKYVFFKRYVNLILC